MDPVRDKTFSMSADSPASRVSNGMDFIAIGDTTVDEFIKLKEAQVHCDIDTEACTITMKWGDKIPFESAEVIPGVGNAANAAVAAARLGLSSGFVSNVGHDRPGEDIIALFKKEGVDTRYIRVHDGIPTNHHYVLMYGAERTILIRHEAYPYALPEDLEPPRWIYLSSVGEGAAAFHDELARWLTAHPDTQLAFQPGTFQIKMGKERLAELYRLTSVVACNKEEAARILETNSTDVKTLMTGMHALGPRIVILTDGPQGAYGFDGTTFLRVPMYPDPAPPVSRTGAGDATTSTIVAALALGHPLAEALAWGPINAMSVVQQVGAQRGLLSRDALLSYLKNAPADYTVSNF